MGVVEQSHETVESYLSTLEESYDSFPVNQATVTVSSVEYERERERASNGSIDLYVTVTNDQADVLHVQEEDHLVVPSTRTTDVPLETAATECVEQYTGVSCHVNTVGNATILGIHDGETDRETVYRLAVVFEAVPDQPTAETEPTSVWHDTAEMPEIVAR